MGGWQDKNVSHTSEGKIISIKGDNYEKAVVSFPTIGRRWKGLISELEKVRVIGVGDMVQVRRLTYQYLKGDFYHALNESR